MRSIMRSLNAACLLTLASLMCSFAALLLFISGSHMAGLLLLAAFSFDLSDGWTARRLNCTSDFGKALDSLADMSSFAVTPAIAIVVISGFSPWWCVSAALFLLCGALRLARFETAEVQPGYFAGVSTPLACCLLLSPLLLWQSFAGEMAGLIVWLYPIYTSLLALSMICDMRIKKYGFFSFFVSFAYTFIAIFTAFSSPCP